MKDATSKRIFHVPIFMNVLTVKYSEICIKAHKVFDTYVFSQLNKLYLVYNMMKKRRINSINVHSLIKYTSDIVYVITVLSTYLNRLLITCMLFNRLDFLFRLSYHLSKITEKKMT